jgi:hypothetical protein
MTGSGGGVAGGGGESGGGNGGLGYDFATEKRMWHRTAAPDRLSGIQ